MCIHLNRYTIRKKNKTNYLISFCLLFPLTRQFNQISNMISNRKQSSEHTISFFPIVRFGFDQIRQMLKKFLLAPQHPFDRLQENARAQAKYFLRLHSSNIALNTSLSNQEYQKRKKRRDDDDDDEEEERCRRKKKLVNI